MLRDSHGLALSTASPEAAGLFDRAVASYLKFRLDARELLLGALKADPQFALGQCLLGYFSMLLYKQALVPAAAKALAEAQRLAAGATERERMHIAALEAWVTGDVARTLQILEQIIAAYSADILAFRLAHYIYFWSGRTADMLASAERALPNWSREQPGYGSVLSCLCFAREENGDYAGAEPAGRAAVELDPADLWGTHAVAHVMEMQGRHRDGIAWLKGLHGHWEPSNGIRHHLWWHRALYHYEQREFDTVLALYDEQFRNLSSPLVKMQPDFVVDIQNAASMLFRLERQGVDVGDRWDEIADKAEARIGDCLSAFTLPHWMMALAAAGRDDAARRMLDGIRAFAGGGGSTAATVGRIALPLSEAVLAHRRGEYAVALDLMRPVIGDTQRLGGSHAQHDVLKQLFLDCATRAGRAPDVRLALALLAGYPVPADQRVGYAAAAQQYRH